MQSASQTQVTISQLRTGTVTTDLTSEWDFATQVILQADGKIIAAGHASNQTHFALVRYNDDGSLDSTFGSGGRVSNSTGGPLKGIAIQADGKILAAGTKSVGSYKDFVLQRYNDNGSLDLTFNGTGQISTSISKTWDY